MVKQIRKRKEMVINRKDPFSAQHPTSPTSLTSQASRPEAPGPNSWPASPIQTPSRADTDRWVNLSASPTDGAHQQSYPLPPSFLRIGRARARAAPRRTTPSPPSCTPSQGEREDRAGPPAPTTDGRAGPRSRILRDPVCRERERGGRESCHQPNSRHRQGIPPPHQP